ncbi:MAG: hypothetical protein KBH29_10105 [Lutibacter sp.]|nr:hypothetical protein [Lutibacter sp.]
MNPTHLHLVLTHFPIIGTIIGVFILSYGIYSKSESITKVALVTFVAMSLLTIPVFLTGEEAAETVENIAGISENIIEEHEELAEIAIWLMGALGVLSLISLLAIIKKYAFSRIVILVTLITSLITTALFVQVGNLGGQIRHSEIRNSSVGIQGENNNSGEHSDDDEDDD